MVECLINSCSTYWHLPILLIYCLIFQQICKWLVYLDIFSAHLETLLHLARPLAGNPKPIGSLTTMTRFTLTVKSVELIGCNRLILDSLLIL